MSDRLAVIAGATSGIGAAYAEAFAKQGYHPVTGLPTQVPDVGNSKSGCVQLH